MDHQNIEIPPAKRRCLGNQHSWTRSGEEFENLQFKELTIVTSLGVGAFGRVQLVQVRGDSTRSFALKKMRKDYIDKTNNKQNVLTEMEIMRTINCNFIVKLVKTFEDSKCLYMLMESCLGGDLSIVLRNNGPFDDDAARFYTGCVVEGLEYLHSQNVVHRDLKPDNLLLDNQGFLKLADFGLAKKLRSCEKAWSFCGTAEYIAPEVILGEGYGVSADYWALGVLVFQFLTGSPPFEGASFFATRTIILDGIDEVDFPQAINDNAKDLIKNLCRRNPAERLGAQDGRINDIRQHKWFDGFKWKDLVSRSLIPPIRPQIKDVTDTRNFDECPEETDEVSDDYVTGWDDDF